MIPPRHNEEPGGGDKKTKLWCRNSDKPVGRWVDQHGHQAMVSGVMLPFLRLALCQSRFQHVEAVSCSFYQRYFV